MNFIYHIFDLIPYSIKLSFIVFFYWYFCLRHLRIETIPSNEQKDVIIPFLRRLLGGKKQMLKDKINQLADSMADVNSKKELLSSSQKKYDESLKSVQAESLDFFKLLPVWSIYVAELERDEAASTLYEKEKGLTYQEALGKAPHGAYILPSFFLVKKGVLF